MTVRPVHIRLQFNQGENYDSTHYLPGVYATADIPEGETSLETLSGETLTVINRDGQIMLEGPAGATARIVEADITGDNGVVHAINTVLE